MHQKDVIAEVLGDEVAVCEELPSRLAAGRCWPLLSFLRGPTAALTDSQVTLLSLRCSLLLS